MLDRVIDELAARRAQPIPIRTARTAPLTPKADALLAFERFRRVAATLPLEERAEVLQLIAGDIRSAIASLVEPA